MARKVEVKSSGWRKVTNEDGTVEMLAPEGATVSGSGEAPKARGKRTEKKGKASAATTDGTLADNIAAANAVQQAAPKNSDPTGRRTRVTVEGSDVPQQVANPPRARKSSPDRTAPAETGRVQPPAAPAEPGRRRAKNDAMAVGGAAEALDKAILAKRNAVEDVETARSGETADVEALSEARATKRVAVKAENAAIVNAYPVPTIPGGAVDAARGRAVDVSKAVNSKPDDNAFVKSQVSTLAMHLAAFRKHAEAHKGGSARARGAMNAARISYHNAASGSDNPGSQAGGWIPGNPDQASPQTDSPCVTPDCPETVSYTAGDVVCPSCEAKGF